MVSFADQVDRTRSDAVDHACSVDMLPCDSLESGLQAGTSTEQLCAPRESQASAATCEHQSSGGSIMRDVVRALSLFQSPKSIAKSNSQLYSPRRLATPKSTRRRHLRCRCRHYVLKSRCALLLVVAAAMVLGLAVMCGPIVIYSASIQESSENLLDHTLRAQAVLAQLTKQNGTLLEAAEVKAYAERLVREIEAFNIRTHSTEYHLKMLSTVIFAATAAIVALCSGLIGHGISRQLQHLYTLRTLMGKLRTLDTDSNRDDLLEVEAGGLSSIREIRELQESFNAMAHAIDRFAHFVPKSVVHRIVRREHKAGRLSVDQRRVTIMFSDIQDFTTMMERLSSQSQPKRLMFVLTRYFTVMTNIIESYEGTVGEILGDGLLAFWNTPLLVERHATKACLAAVAQQHAIRALNAGVDFTRLGINLKIRIGVHTGQVLAGNIGSFTKMKFGCIGDPMNLAARLEGLCKFYGVGIICSGDTHGEVGPHEGVVARRLDLVQVKGKTQPTEIYEIIGCDRSASDLLGPDQHTGPIPNMVDVVSEAIGKLNPNLALSGSSEDAIRWGFLAEKEEPTAISSSSWSTAGGTLSEKEDDLCGRPGEEDDAAYFEHLVSDGIDPKRRASAAKYEDALQAYQQGSFAKAHSLTSELLAEAPEDTAATKLFEKSARDLEQVTSEEALEKWNPVAVMLDK